MKRVLSGFIVLLLVLGFFGCAGLSKINVQNNTQDVISGKVLRLEGEKDGYRIWISSDSVNWSVFGDFISPKDTDNLMKFFKVNKAEKIIGKKFQIPKKWANQMYKVLNYLIVQGIHNGKYLPPTDVELYERAAQSLAKMENPDFYDVDDITVFEVFYKAFYSEGWLEYLTGRIKMLSGGKVVFRKATKEEFGSFKCRVRGPAKYMILESEEKKIRLRVGPYSSPIAFDRD